ncbi:MAG TPA: bifunctional oligoribonuclease/PAP phosphatase NrnA [Streptosporangiaceae bacterium]|nr:bifunctional oligoribonuclease/PAP phosphatase NrnA [Streptosporangiaceae bacterium]
MTAERMQVQGDNGQGQPPSDRSFAVGRPDVPGPAERLDLTVPSLCGSQVPAAAGLPGSRNFPSAAAAQELEASWARAVKILDGAREICLACHIRPDGDALGSMLAVAHALRSQARSAGQRVIASFGDQPFEVPRILRFLPGADLLSPPDGYPERPQVMVTFDAASADRLGVLEACARRADELIVLDHHASNTRFGTLHLIDPSAAATAVLAHELIGRMGIRVTRDIAFGLYAGIVTDTGSFKYDSTSPRVHEIAAELLATGIEPGAVSLELWDKAPFGYLGMLSAVLGRAVLEPEAAAGHGLVWTTVSRADRAAYGLHFDVAESVIDVLRRTEEADVAVVFKESDNGQWLVSSRSKGKVDVGRACTRSGGGGHRSAAGFTASGTIEQAMAGLREHLSDGADSRQ